MVRLPVAGESLTQGTHVDRGWIRAGLRSAVQDFLHTWRVAELRRTAYPPRALPIGFRIFAQESALLAQRLLGANEPRASASLSVTDKLFLYRT